MRVLTRVGCWPGTAQKSSRSNRAKAGSIPSATTDSTKISTQRRGSSSAIWAFALSVNLKHPTGARLIRELAGKSDAILQNFRPRVLDKLGLGDGELRKLNPKLVIVKMPGFGSEGPKSAYGTWGFNLTAFSGMTYLWNHPEQDRPIGSQGVYPDHLGFVMGPMLIVAALLNSRRTGKGVTIDLAQIEGTAAVLGTTYLETSLNGDDPQPKGNHYAAAAPHGC